MNTITTQKKKNLKYFTYFTFSMINSIRTATISSKRQITLPKEFSQFKPGEKTLIIAKDGIVTIRPIPKQMSETALLTEQALGEAWNSKEDEEAFAYLQK